MPDEHITLSDQNIHPLQHDGDFLRDVIFSGNQIRGDSNENSDLDILILLSDDDTL